MTLSGRQGATSTPCPESASHPWHGALTPAHDRLQELTGKLYYTAVPEPTCSYTMALGVGEQLVMRLLVGQAPSQSGSLTLDL